MKLTKLSLAVCLMAGVTSSVLAADTLAEAFKEGKVTGTLKAMYIGTEYAGATVDSDAFAVGGELGYKTGSLNGFSAAFTVETSHTMGAQSSIAAENDGSVSIQKTLLSEAYLAYTFEKTSIQAGRMYLGLPLVSSSGSRLMKDYFQAITITNTSLPETTLVAAAANEWVNRNGAQTHYADPLYTVYANNKSITGLSLIAQMTTKDNDGEQYFLEAAYKVPSKFPLTLGAQYVADNQDNAKDSAFYGLMVGTEVAGIGLAAYYGSTESDNKVRAGYGNGNDWTYNSIHMLTGATAGTDSYRGKVSYDFSKVGVTGLSAFVTYAQYDQDVANGNHDASEFDFDATYAFSGSLKGLSAQIRYAIVNYDLSTDEDKDQLRFIANYKF